MKKIVSILIVFTLMLTFASCGSNSTQSEEFSEPIPHNNESNSAPAGESDNQGNSSKAPAPESDPTEADSKSLVVYFSCTGNTKAVAEKIADLTGSDFYEIVPEVTYTEDDLNYNNEDCRANREMNDASARPSIGSEKIDVSAYDTVFIGYPIWWGTMPRIINTFLDDYDLSDKTLMPFCTSGGSGISQSVLDIRSAESNADVKDGLRASGTSDGSITEWLAENGLAK